MNTVTPVVFTTPDGVERTLRATMGARKRIAQRFGLPTIKDILKAFGDGVLPEIAHCMMYDAKANAPDISAEELAESITPDDATALLANVLAAFSQGKVSPNEAEALLEEAAKILAEMELQKKNGSISGDSAGSASDSQTSNSGTDSLSAKSTLSAEPTETRSIDEPAS